MNQYLNTSVDIAGGNRNTEWLCLDLFRTQQIETKTNMDMIPNTSMGGYEGVVNSSAWICWMFNRYEDKHIYQW